MSDIASHLLYVWRGTGLLNTLQRIARKLISPIFESDTAYIGIRYQDLESVSVASDRAQVEQEISTSIFENLDELKSLGDSDSNKILLPELRDFLDQAPNRFVLLALRRQPGDIGHEILGYFGIDRGEFSYWDRRLTGLLPPDCIYSMRVYVLPAHRGTRVILAMRETLDKYCREHGIRKRLAFIKTHNAPSLNAYMRPHADSVGTIKGTITRRTFFGGLYERITSPETVLSIIDAHMPKS